MQPSTPPVPPPVNPGVFDLKLQLYLLERLYVSTLLPIIVRLDGAFEQQIWPGGGEFK
jgi:hypothetical protein